MSWVMGKVVVLCSEIELKDDRSSNGNNKEFIQAIIKYVRTYRKLTNRFLKFSMILMLTNSSEWFPTLSKILTLVPLEMNFNVVCFAQENGGALEKDF